MESSHVLLLFLLTGQNSFLLCSSVISNYSDPCDYYNGVGPCGDVCVTKYATCICGEVVIRNTIFGDPHYCCIPPEVKCKKTIVGATCPEGDVLEVEHTYTVDVDKFNVTGSTPCHGRCFNDYFTSPSLSLYAHFACPDKCVHWSAMCRGVSFCDGDQEVCGEDLRCPSSARDGNVTKGIS